MTPQQNRLSGENNLTYLMIFIITLSLIGKLVGIGDMPSYSIIE